jgi:pimeloyl-ACP methyl ester carboxylesterase
MKFLPWNISGSLALSILLLSCAPPDVKILDHPIPGSPTAKRDELRKTSKRILEREGLAKDYQRDPYAALRTLASRQQESPTADRLFALADLCGTLGSKQADKDPTAAAGCYLDAARLTRASAIQSALSGNEGRLLLIYNESCASLTSILKDQNWKFPQRFTGPLRTYHLGLESAPEAPIDWSDYADFVVADRVELEHANLKAEHQLGIGGALVGHRPKQAIENADRDFSGSHGFTLPVNSMLDFQTTGDHCTLVLRNLLTVESIKEQGRRVPLAANWSASLAYLYQFAPDSKVGFEAMLRPAEYDSLTFLYSLAPFDPDKIPVILIHGLMSSPTTWVNMLNRLRTDPVLRNNYQAVLFRYPSGYPISRNAAVMHQMLADYRKMYTTPRSREKMQQMVMIGHSMGGNLSSIEVRDSGESIWDLFFDRPADQMPISPHDQKELHDLFHFKANPDVERAIFIAAPHRGSNLARKLIGDLGHSLIRLPSNALDIGLSLGQVEQLPGLSNFGKSQINARPNSITSLRPSSEYLKAIVDLPLGQRVTYHTIAGQVNQNAPRSEGTDTVVPYWSSHLDGATSEKIVDASHTKITHHPDSIEDVRRILYLHLGRKAPTPIAAPAVATTTQQKPMRPLGIR